VLTVEDTGTGMAPGVREKIFDPFFTTKEPGKGTGLGLSTAHSIVKSHGGFINVYSEPGKGASFKVYLPAAEQGASPHGESTANGVPMGEGELILIVDDESSIRDITGQILESYGYEVATAVDGTSALVQFIERKNEIRLVITDMMMPYMDGAATIRAIRNIDPRMRVVATSGLMLNEYASEAKSLGVQAFLAKPYTAETLLQTIREVLERASPAASD
jgi:two-component system, cell cycle sensor histidine kinase and response regulator CckA